MGRLVITSDITKTAVKYAKDRSGLLVPVETAVASDVVVNGLASSDAGILAAAGSYGLVTQGTAIYTNVVRTPPASIGNVTLINSISLLEAAREDSWNFGSNYPTSSRYYFFGPGANSTFILDLRGIAHTLRFPLDVRNYGVIKIIAPRWKLRVNDQYNYPRPFPGNVVPSAPLNGAIVLRVAPADPGIVWIEGNYVDAHDPTYAWTNSDAGTSGTGLSLMCDMVVWRGQYMTPNSGYNTSSFTIQNCRYEGAEGSNHQPDGTPQYPELHADLFQNQGASVDPVGRPRYLYFENVMHSNSMGAITHIASSLGTTDEGWLWLRRCNFRQTEKYTVGYRDASGIGVGDTGHPGITKADILAGNQGVYYEDYHYQRQYPWVTAVHGTWQAPDRAYVLDKNAAETTYMTPHPEVTDYSPSNPDIWYGPAFTEEENLGYFYVSPHVHDHE